MSRPTIVTVDDDPQVAAALTRDLLTRYGSDYRVVRTTSGAEALGVLGELALRDEPVAPARAARCRSSAASAGRSR